LDYFIKMFLHNYLPNPILLDLNVIKIYWYGFLITIGVIFGFLVFYKLAIKKNISKDKIFDLFFWGIIWGIVGARLYHVFSEINYYWFNPLKIFYFWNGGMGIYGAVIAEVLVIYYFAKKNAQNYQLSIINYQLLLLDLLVPALALGQAIGRWGNYFNQELYGLPTNLSWGIPIALENRLPQVLNFTHFHPTFLYESLFCLFLFVLLYLLIIKKDFKSGFIFFLYLILYPTERFLIEFLRIDYQPVFWGLRLGHWASLFFLCVGVVGLILINKINKKAKH